MKINIKELDQTIYYEKLANGLEIYLVPFENKNNYMMSYITKFGSLATTFIPYNKNKYITVPDGIAHFLEHKMFEQVDGIDPFTFAAKSGTYSNAATNFDSTRYYFEGNKNFKENLNYLLDFVGSPYFTDENVEKEKGIIAEEIKQYDDEIGWFIEEEIYKALLHNDNHRIDIAGTVETIDKITKEDLYDTYYTFYQPSNMFLVISGNFDVEEALSVIKNNKVLLENKTNKKVEIKKIDEPNNVKDKYKELTFNINNTKLAYAIKIPADKDNLLLKLYTSIMLENKFGNSSLFREELKKKNLYTKFSVGKEDIDNYLIISFIVDTNYPQEVVELIKEELKNIDIQDEEINRIKKVWIASSVMGSDDVSYTNEVIIHEIINYNKLLTDKINIYRSLNKKDYLKTINNLNFDNDTIIVIKPNKK